MKQNVVKRRNYLYEALGIIEILAILGIWLLIAPTLNGAVIGAILTYYPLAWGLRLTLQRHHRAGMRLLKKEQFAEALPCFQKSEAFFTRHEWVDKYRFITMFASSAYSYREMALQNQAYALIHMQQLQEATVPLEKLLALRPDREDIVQLLQALRAEIEKVQDTE